MNKDELEKVTTAAIALNNAVVEQNARKRALEDESRRFEKAKAETKTARDELIKVLRVGRNNPMRSVRLRDTMDTVIVTWASLEENGPGLSEHNGGSVTVYISGPDGATLV